MHKSFEYKVIAIKGKTLFKCIECQLMVVNEDVMRDHLRDNHWKSRRVVTQSSHSSTDDKHRHKVFNRFKSINKWGNNVFKCPVIGCAKVLFYKNSFDFHKRQHLMPKLSKDRRRTTGDYVMSVQLNRRREEPEVGHKPTGDHCLETRVKRAANEPLVNSKGFTSFKRVEMHCKRSIFEGRKQITCNFCGHKTFGIRSTTQMAVHINGRHLRHSYKCNEKGCNKAFSSPTTLRIHKQNHFCGFGFGFGKTLTTVCGIQSILRYRQKVVKYGLKFFKCTFNSCMYFTSSRVAIKRHIHNHHLCPNRIHYISQNPNSIDIIEHFDEFAEVNERQNLYKCKKCTFISEKVSSLLAHIKFKHLQIKYYSKSLKPDFKNFNNYMRAQSLENNDSMTETQLNHRISMDYITYMEDKQRAKDLKNYAKKWHPFGCNKCCRRFDDLIVFNTHMKSHNL